MTTLSKAFDSKTFKETGMELINFLADTFENADKREVIPYKTPEEQYLYWKKDFTISGNPEDLFKDVVNRSILYHHPHYMGHQTAVPALTSVLSSLVIDFMSNGMGVYEVGMVGNTMERVVCEHLCDKFGLGEDAGGFITSGGTLGTLTAILTAKAHYIHKHECDAKDIASLTVITSEQSHYCIERAAKTMGISSERIIKIPVDEDFRMRTDLLEEAYDMAEKSGKKVFCIVASAPSTSTGTHDDLIKTGKFCQEKDIWFHADGAHGAPAVFSEKYKYLVDGIGLADSVVMDFHKMMLTPGISTAVLLKHRHYAFETFRQEAEYLWNKNDFEWHHGGKSTFECTKSMSILKVYSLFKQFGDKVFEEFVDYQYDLTKEFAKLINCNHNFETAHNPDSNILCFRYTDCENPDSFNVRLREQIMIEGKFYIVQTSLNGKTYLRVTLLNPRTTIYHLERLLKELETTAKKLKLQKA